MVHVEEVGVAETFYVLGEGHCLLDVTVLLVVAGPDGIVDDDAVYGVVLVGADDGFLENFLVYLAEIKCETTAGLGQDWCSLYSFIGGWACLLTSPRRSSWTIPHTERQQDHRWPGKPRVLAFWHQAPEF